MKGEKSYIAMEEPYPHRFKTSEEGMEFLAAYSEKRESKSAPVAPLIRDGNAIRINPEWEEAQFEMTTLLETEQKPTEGQRFVKDGFLVLKKK